MFIVNVRVIGQQQFRKSSGVYCGRPSVLGNPFVVGKDGSREDCIELYRRWLWVKIQQQDSAVMKALSSLHEDSVLGCWCSPLSCHCEVIESAWRYLFGVN